jgi:hypothetical protein
MLCAASIGGSSLGPLTQDKLVKARAVPSPPIDKAVLIQCLFSAALLHCGAAAAFLQRNPGFYRCLNEKTHRIGRLPASDEMA